jgi:hypothetical protein
VEEEEAARREDQGRKKTRGRGQERNDEKNEEENPKKKNPKKSSYHTGTIVCPMLLLVKSLECTRISSSASLPSLSTS